MATVLFYEKPGCVNNTRQKRLLQQAGHRVVAKNLLQEDWDEARLLEFFKGLPVAEWFNRAAPGVKSGAVVPERVSAREALSLMLAEPLLIRRPLMQVGTACRAGFDPVWVGDWIGLKPLSEALAQDLEQCPHDAHVAACPERG